METGPKDINCKLNSDKLKKLIKNEKYYPPVRVHLVWTYLVVSKNFPHTSLERKNVPKRMHPKPKVG